MGSKFAVKVFKRKDVQQAIHHTSEPRPAENFEKEEVTERRNRRELVSTITNWVSERRERSRTEEIEAVRKLFGNTTPTLTGA